MTAARPAAITPPAVEPPADMTSGYRVRVVEHISEQLAGVPGCRYDSPLQTRNDALGLVRVLLGGDPDLTRSHWERPIAGGHRSVDLVWEQPR
jgi:hypothetical protein